MYLNPVPPLQPASSTRYPLDSPYRILYTPIMTILQATSLHHNYHWPSSQRLSELALASFTTQPPLFPLTLGPCFLTFVTCIQQTHTLHSDKLFYYLICTAMVGPAKHVEYCGVHIVC